MFRNQARRALRRIERREQWRDNGSALAVYQGPDYVRYGEHPNRHIPNNILAVYEGPCLRERVHDVFDELGWERAPAPAPEPNTGPSYFTIPIREESWFRKTIRAAKRMVMSCCGEGEAVADWRREDAFGHEVAKEMLTPVVVAENETIPERVVREVTAVNEKQVHHVPRLVVEVTVALRCKLGAGAFRREGPGNVAVVRAEAAKLLREWNVRHKDAAAHLVEIEKCFFEDDTHYRVTTWRARLAARSRFMRWFVGNNDPVGFDY